MYNFIPKDQEVMAMNGTIGTKMLGIGLWRILAIFGILFVSFLLG